MKLSGLQQGPADMVGLGLGENKRAEDFEQSVADSL